MSTSIEMCVPRRPIGDEACKGRREGLIAAIAALGVASCQCKKYVCELVAREGAAPAVGAANAGRVLNVRSATMAAHRTN